MRWRTDRKLRLVAATYRQAVEAVQPPTLAVAHTLHVSHSQAANLVAKARRLGYLERADTPVRSGPA